MILDIFKILILSLVEGLTEFVPISSTGHMILVDNFIKLSENRNFVISFQIIIQLGAILSVVVYYWDKLFPFSKKNSKKKQKEIINMWIKIMVGLFPAIILGLLFDDLIEEYFFNSFSVAVMLTFYGILLILIESINKNVKITEINQITLKTSLAIGLFQCLALIPGTSRSAATIIGGILLGLNRMLATEFSFFLAIPTMIGASTLKILKMGNVLSNYEWFLIALGFLFSFIISYFVIKNFINFIKKNDFKIFGYYRIFVGIIILTLYFIGVIN